jgi:hypothetical protein
MVVGLEAGVRWLLGSATVVGARDTADGPTARWSIGCETETCLPREAGSNGVNLEMPDAERKQGRAGRASAWMVRGVIG